MNWKTCSKHGDANPNAWDCPDCAFELRRENRKQENEIAALKQENERANAKIAKYQALVWEIGSADVFGKKKVRVDYIEHRIAEIEST